MKISLLDFFALLSTALVVNACQTTGASSSKGGSVGSAAMADSANWALDVPAPDWINPGRPGDLTAPVKGDFRNFLIADQKNHRIVGLNDMNGFGEIDLVLPKNGQPQGFFENWNADMKLYITDGHNNLIIRTDDLDGTNMITFGSMGSGLGHFKDPREIVVDSRNRIYVVDSGNNRIVRIDDMSGTNWVGLGERPGCGKEKADPLKAPNAIALDGNGRIYIADAGNNRIVRVDDMKGSNWTVLGGKGDGSDRLRNPMGVYVTGNDRILIADTDNNRIVQVDDMAGMNWTTLGSKGDGTGQFNAPRGINDFGLICIADSQNNRLVQIEDIAGAGWRTYGFKGRGLGQLDDPWDVWDP